MGVVVLAAERQIATVLGRGHVHSIALSVHGTAIAAAVQEGHLELQ